MRCISAVLLTIVLLLPAAAMVADYSEAEDPIKYHDGNFTFILNSSGKAVLTMFDNKNSETNVVIPSPLTAKETGLSYELEEIRNFSDSDRIETVTIPASVTTIDEMAFRIAYGLKSFVVDVGSTAFDTDGDGVLYTSDFHKLIRFPSNSDETDYTIHTDTSEICEGAFYNAFKLTSVTFDNNLLKISDSAFCSCIKLATVTFNSSLSVIGTSAFFECTDLTTVVFPNNLNMIGSHAFYKTGLTGTVKIPYGLEYIGNAAFACCPKLTGFTSDNYQYTSPEEGADKGILFKGEDDGKSIVCYPSNRPDAEYTIPAKMGIEANAFEGCMNLKIINLPTSYTSVPEMSFYGCKSLESIGLNRVSVIGAFAFFECENLKTIEFSDSLLLIDDCAFLMSGLTELNIPSNVATINDLAFSGCRSLIEVTIAESSAASLGEGVFSGDTSLKTITINSKDVKLTTNTLDIGLSEEDTANVDVYVKSGYTLPSDVANDYTTLNIKIIGERPYPWVNIIGAVVCAIGIIGILYGMRQV